MIVPNPVKISGQLVGVIADRTSLRRALRLRRWPDFLELRLDSLADRLEETERTRPRLHAPFIITARHPAEGGVHGLSASTRRALLRRFLDRAAYVDIELRAVGEMESFIAEARAAGAGLIISRHDFSDTPEPAVLRAQLRRAVRYQPDIFKIATRTDTRAQLARLLDFFRDNSDRLPIAAMGMGKLGLASRRQLLRLGSALNYAAVGASNAPGQPTLANLRRTRAAYIK